MWRGVLVRVRSPPRALPCDAEQNGEQRRYRAGETDRSWRSEMIGDHTERGDAQTLHRDEA